MDEIKKKKVLIVDDVDVSLRFMEAVLKEHYSVTTADNGHSALIEIHQNCPDLIILDLEMPVMNGFEVCEKIKSNFVFRDIPVIISSVTYDKSTIRKAFDLGAVDYLLKPISPEKLLIRVNSHLNHENHLPYYSPLEIAKERSSY